MSNLVDLLFQYKNSIINLAKYPNEKKYIEDSFTRWYFNVKKKDFIPQKNLVNTNDLKFGNLHRKCKFNIPQFLKESKNLYTQFKKNIDNIKQEKYSNEDNLISLYQLNRLKELYKENNFEDDKNKLINIYKFLGINSIHLSIPPVFEGIELFGSPINTHNPYCSPFEFEKLFGSLGSFFDFDIANSDETLFTCNPPFDEDIMEKMSKRLEEQLSKCKTPKTIIITLPVWDSESQKKIGIRDFGMIFKSYELLCQSKFFNSKDILDRALFPYWDYYKLALIPASYTHLIILSIDKPKYDIQQIKQKWQDFIDKHKN
jgi:hypothetical protein